MKIYATQLAAEARSFNARERMDVKAARRMELFFAVCSGSCIRTREDAAIDMEQEDVFRVGVMIGSGVGSLATVELAHEKIVEKGPGRVSPMMIPLMISNMAAGNVSIQLGARGKCTNVVTACASVTHCIGAFSGNSVWRCGWMIFAEAVL